MTDLILQKRSLISTSSLILSTNHTTFLWLIQFSTLLDDYFILLFLLSKIQHLSPHLHYQPSTLLPTLLRKKITMKRKYQRPPTLTYSLTHLCLCSCTLPSCLGVSMTSLLFTEASYFCAPDPSPLFLLKDIISDFSLLFCIIRYLFLPNTLELSHQLLP